MVIQAVTSSERPDWSSIQEEIHCPLCGYNLHGLAEPRCPECGYAFDWPDLLDPSRRLHPYLFEHHPERNSWSFWRTAAGAMLPGRFWRALQPVQPSRPGRLVLYWVLTVAVCYVCVKMAIAPYAAWMACRVVEKDSFYRQDVLAGKAQVQSPHPQFGPVGVPITDPELLRQYLDQYCPTGVIGWLKAMVRACAAWPEPFVWWPLAWPWLMFAGLMIFQRPIRRSKVSAIHVLRCAIYSGGTLVWAGLTGLAVFWAGTAQMYFWPMKVRTDIIMVSVVFAVVGALLLWMIHQLIVACRLYMRFGHAVATVLSALAIALVTPFAVYMLLMAVFPGRLPGRFW